MGIKQKVFSREHWIQRSLSAALALGLGTIIYQLPLDFLEAYTYDSRVAWKPVAPVSHHIQTVAIDTRTLKSMQREPQAPVLAAVIRRILAARPQKLIVLLDPSKVEGSSAERFDFARVLESPNVIVAVDDLPTAGQINSLKLAPPFENVNVLPGPITADKNILAKDGVTRRLILSSEGQQTFLSSVGQIVSGRAEGELGGQFDLLDARQAFVEYRPAGTYEPISFIDIVSDPVAPAALNGKIVLLGRDARESVKEYVMTPYSREVVAMSALELQANSLDTVIMNRAPVLLPNGVRFILTILFSLLTVTVVLGMRPLKGLGILGGTLLGFVMASHILFIVPGWWVPMAHPLLVVFVCYYFFIPYRLIRENRRSWEYYQKNKLLTQVEELKSNFLRMMSHDLRTPLARIQGMANVVLADNNPLNDSQRRAVETIYRSSEELADFIGSILNLGRIESKEIKLQLKSKDINSLLRDVIRKSEFLARKKGIELRTELEPMFSFKIDEDLIRQVFTNLIENAIKYSPENGKILISTEELEGRAIIQVADQGMGINEEDLPHVFDKFFRSRSVRQSEIGGSGLGLYLVKYFVGLHHGKVDVESEAGKGSTFSVTLPMVMDLQQQSSAHWREGVHHV